jgi:hypothetical protein
MAHISKKQVADSLILTDQLSCTGYTIGWVLNMLHENNPHFVKALGDGKVAKVGLI